MTTTDCIHPKDIKEVVLGDGAISIQEVIAVARYGAIVSFHSNIL